MYPQKKQEVNIMKIINDMKTGKHITKNIPQVIKNFMIKRDICLLLVLFLFKERLSSTLNLKIQDVFREYDELKIRFIRKSKSKTVLVCPKCQEENKKDSKYCSYCGFSLDNAEKKIIGQEAKAIIKSISLSSSDLVFYILDYIDFLEKNDIQKDWPLFPSVKLYLEKGDIKIKVVKRPLKRIRVYKILKYYGITPAQLIKS